MPNRIIKESICSSETLAEVTPEAERLWWRVITRADDFGRFEASPKVLLGQCLTAFLGEITLDNIDEWLCELVGADLIRLYEVEGKRYLQVTSWDKHQQRRAQHSKYPAPDDTCNHLHADDIHCEQTQEDDSNGEQADAVDTLFGNEERGTRNDKRVGKTPPSLPIQPDEVVALWNEICSPPLPEVRKLTDGRRRKIKTRITDESGRDCEWWRSYFNRIRGTPFLTGTNDRNWVANFDFAVNSEENVAKILEGAYDRAKGKNGAQYRTVDDLFKASEGG